MTATARTYPPPRRTGITLMEVLISIGIIAIGLTSVMSLIPAGKSEASKALLYDRAATLALNGISDAVTYGLACPAAIAVSDTSAATVIFEPATVIPFASQAAQGWPAGVTSGVLRTDGIFASGASSAAAPQPVIQLITVGRDDLNYTPPPTPDDLPLNRFLLGSRAYDGKMTSFIAITELPNGSPPLEAGDWARISAVVFHNRNTETPLVSATITDAGLVTPTSALPPDRSLKSVIRPGTILFYEQDGRLRFARTVMASAEPSGSIAYITTAGGPPPGGPIGILVDSVGLCERVVRLEGPGPYSQ